MVLDSLIITVIGLTGVFLFLFTMVFVMGSLQYIMPIINKFLPEPIEPVKKQNVSVQTNEAAVAAAVGLAFSNSGGNK